MITKDTLISDITRNPKKTQILLDHGIHCIGCAAARFETLEQGLKAHGMSDEEIDELIKKLNKD